MSGNSNTGSRYCKKCKKQVLTIDGRCAYCGEWEPDCGDYVLVIIVTIIIIVIIMGMLENANKSRPSPRQNTMYQTQGVSTEQILEMTKTESSEPEVETPPMLEAPEQLREAGSYRKQTNVPTIHNMRSVLVEQAETP